MWYFVVFVLGLGAGVSVRAFRPRELNLGAAAVYLLLAVLITFYLYAVYDAAVGGAW